MFQVALAQHTRSTAEKAQMAVLHQSIAIVLCLLIAWTPYAIVCLTITIIKANPFPIYVSAIPSLFAKTSNCWNPIVYYNYNKQVYKMFMLLLSNVSYDFFRFFFRIR